MTRKKFELPDQNLWDEVKSSITPIKRTRRGKVAKEEKPPAPKPLATRALEVPSHKPRARNEAPALSSFDRRTAQKLGRGQMEPEARIDLHGENLENARFGLLHFLASRRMQGLRMVLVITGKGASPFARHTLHGLTHFNTPEREGKLRRELPRWLEEAQFRIHVVGFQPAHPRHGGGGAFYVRLRKHNGEFE
ncbi:Smr/MutS family protein [Aestuariivirga litoralis]|uniref:Smr/MutS family protein n=1 Tax=Aestuariivirga litoralis TaxID=2650924 RepID=UPI0018C84CF1|nr:Smr/MutS family protein [Aestuariivirga litoralis]